MTDSKEQAPDVPLLSRDWEHQQIRSFTAWMNHHGKKHGLEIADIRTDLRDGRKLLRFLDIISGEPSAKPEKGNLRVHQINNVRHALDYIAKKGIKLAYTGAEEIVDGNLKMTLGMIWVIILRYAINIISEGSTSASDGLLLWVKKKTEGYRGVNVNNFTSSFQDGLVLNALIHKHRPDLLDYDSLKKENALDNLNQAFDIAEKHLDIPRLLDAQDTHMYPDSKSVMTYVACFYHAFSKDQVVENASRRINRVLDANEENAALAESYENVATDLLNWIKDKTESFKEEISEDELLEDLLKKVDDITVYRKDEKPPKASEKSKLSNLINTMRTRAQLQKRPEFTPLDGHTVKDINSAWDEMEKYEKTRLDRLHMLIKKLQFIDYLYKKYMYKCDQQDAWISGRKDPLTVDISKMNMSEVLRNQRNMKTIESDLAGREARTSTIGSLQQRLRELNCKDMSTVDARHEKIDGEFKDLYQTFVEFKEKLAEREKVLKELDDMKHEYAQGAPKLRNFLDEAIEDLNDTYQVKTVEEIKELKEEHDNFVGRFTESEAQLKECLELEKKINESEDPHNEYSSIKGEELQEKFDTVQSTMAKRSELLEDEHQKQLNNDTLKKEFATLAEEIDAFRTKMLQSVTEVQNGGDNFETQVERLKEVAVEVENYYKEKLPQVSESQKVLQEANVFHNPFTTHTAETINQEYQNLVDSIASLINEVENQIIVRDSTNITEQQVMEYKKSFDYFDKNKDSYLSHEEFRSFLISQEYKVSPDEEGGEVEFQKIIVHVDSEKAGEITFNSFLNFVAIQNKDTDNAEEVVEAFRVIAGGKDFILPDAIRKEFPEKADKIISEMPKYTGDDAPEDALDYTLYSNSLYGETEL